MTSEQMTEILIGCFDCKQGAVRAVRFNGNYFDIYTSWLS